jgi:hypothetical protein
MEEESNPIEPTPKDNSLSQEIDLLKQKYLEAESYRAELEQQNNILNDRT